MNMEQVLGRVLELETKSKEIVKKATDRRDSLEAEIESRLGEMRNKYNAEAEKRIEIIRTEEKKRLESELDRVRTSHTRQMKLLRDAADREFDNWTALIFKNVIEAEQS